MSFLLDTNVISEWVKPQPTAKVINWLEAVDEEQVFLSVVTIAEIRHGIEQLPNGNRRQRLAAWLAGELIGRFEDRILGIDLLIAEHWGILMARAKRAGIVPSTMDGFVAATAETYALTLVTRDTGNLGKLGIKVFNPWN